MLRLLLSTLVHHLSHLQFEEHLSRVQLSLAVCTPM